MANESLTSAKKAKDDEFYTLYEDVEKEINSFLGFDKNTFKDKVILLPCDNPEWSNFTKYFAENFKKLGLKKLISTSFAPAVDVDSESYKMTEIEQRNGKKFVLTDDITGDGVVNFDDFEWEYLNGNGDFRSDEVSALRDEADIIVTNPPFSLFRDFMAWLQDGNKDFLIIGNMNAITYKEVYPLIKSNQVWLGVNNGAKTYVRPDGSFDKLGNTCWFTNVDHGRRHEPLSLMTTKENLKFNKKIKEVGGYHKYNNYDAIEVPRVDAIPSDYDGVMGVPISFLNKYNPEQFEIVKFRHGDDGKDLMLPNGKTPYFRVLIRHIQKK